MFFLSSLSKPLPGIEIPFLDKALHICEFIIFALLLSRALKNSSKKILFQNFKIIAVLVSVLYGISDEYHQYFTSERQCSLWDVLADSIGGTIGVLIYGRYCPV